MHITPLRFTDPAPPALTSPPASFARSSSARRSTLRYVSIWIVSLALLACGSDDDDDFPAETSADLQQTLDDAVAAEVSPGVALVVRHPSYGTWSGAAGVSNLTSERSLDPADRFRAGSLLKTMVATVALTLVEDGACSLDDTLSELLPADVWSRIEHAEQITLRMLLDHTSGIADFTNGDFDAQVLADPSHVWTLDEVLTRATAQAPTFAPGEGWSYTNTGYVLVGEVITRVSGRPWRALVRERVLVRAGLDETSLPDEGNLACPRCARGYQDVDGVLRDVTEVDPSMAGASGGHALITTPGDLVKFFAALVDGTFFSSPESLTTMLDFVDAPVPDEAQTGYGIGLQRFAVGDVELVGHLGGTAGYQAFALVHPGSGLIVSGYVNAFGNLGDFILPVLEAVGRIP
jgi:D-alanyl-D-alanine carboxypeptidase